MILVLISYQPDWISGKTGSCSLLLNMASISMFFSAESDSITEGGVKTWGFSGTSFGTGVSENVRNMFYHGEEIFKQKLS